MRFVSLSVLALLSTQMARADVENFLPVSLKCPKGDNGSLELVMKNGATEAQRITSDFDAKGISHLKVEASQGGKPFATKLDFNMHAPLGDHDRSFADKIRLTVDGYLEHCKDGKTDRKFEREMARNRRQLKRTIAEERADAAREESVETSGE